MKGENIININLTFIPSPEKKVQKELKQQRLFRWIRLFYFFAVLVIISIHFFYKFLWLEGTTIETYMNSTNFFGKLSVILTINQLLNLASPVENNEGKLSYTKKDMGARIFVLLFWGVLAYFLAIRIFILN